MRIARNFVLSGTYMCGKTKRKVKTN